MVLIPFLWFFFKPSGSFRGLLTIHRVQEPSRVHSIGENTAAPQPQMVPFLLPPEANLLWCGKDSNTWQGPHLEVRTHGSMLRRCMLSWAGTGGRVQRPLLKNPVS